MFFCNYSGTSKQARLLFLLFIIYYEQVYRKAKVLESIFYHKWQYDVGQVLPDVGRNGWPLKASSMASITLTAFFLKVEI